VRGITRRVGNKIDLFTKSVIRFFAFMSDEYSVDHSLWGCTDVVSVPQMIPDFMSRDAWLAIANAFPVLAYRLDADGAIDLLNDRWFEEIGMSDSLRDFRYGDALHPSDRDRVARRLQFSLASGDPYQDEFRLRVGNGRYRTFRSSACASRDASGAIVAWQGVAIDIEEIVAARQCKGDADTQIVWTADATGWIDWYNDRWFEYTGQTPAEAEGWGWQSAHHPDDFLRVMELWPRSIETGESFELEFRLRGRDGTYRWFLARCEPLRNDTDEIVRWYGSITDIEVQKRASERSTSIAETLQQSFPPEHLPIHRDLRFDGLYESAESEAFVGGDWYDAIDLPGGRILISCGDVAGHGVAASASVGRLRQSILLSALELADPAAILERVNSVVRFQDASAATCIVAILEPQSLELTYALAGHLPPVVAFSCEAASALSYAETSPLGVIDDLSAVNETVTLAKDAVVAFYTNGLTEFAREIDAAQGRLCRAVDALVGDTTDPHPARALARAVMGDTPSPGDVALLVLQCSKPPRTAVTTNGTTPLVKRWRFHSSDARTARISRQELMTFLTVLATSDAELYSAELILGEILANTVEHAPGLVEITIDWTAACPLLTVRDRGPGLPEAIAVRPCVPLDPLDENGRGLFLIATLARDVRVESPIDGGTRIVATLPLARRTATDALFDEVAQA